MPKARRQFLISVIQHDLNYAAPATVPFMPATQRNRLCALWRKAVRCAAGVNEQDDLSPLLSALKLTPINFIGQYNWPSFSTDATVVSLRLTLSQNSKGIAMVEVREETLPEISSLLSRSHPTVRSPFRTEAH